MNQPQERASLERKKRKGNHFSTQDPLCSHNNNVDILLTVKKQSGHNLRRWQCICGAIVGHSSKAEEEELNIKPVPFNFEKFAKHEKRVTAAFEELRRKSMEKYTTFREERSKSHAEYCLTPEWREVRERVLKRDNYLCQGCLINRATLVHHKSYDFVRRELCDLLISYCNDCHKKVHGLDREAS